MERIVIGKKLAELAKKYRYALLVLILGLALMLIPGKKQTESAVAPELTPEETTIDLAAEISGILSQIEGAGKVEVLLTVSAGEETVYQTDVDTSSDGASRADTVIITDAERAQSGLIRQVNPPVYLGAIIVCQGADSAAVRLVIVEAVSRLTGLGTNQISVLKMK